MATIGEFKDDDDDWFFMDLRKQCLRWDKPVKVTPKRQFLTQNSYFQWKGSYYEFPYESKGQSCRHDQRPSGRLRRRDDGISWWVLWLHPFRWVGSNWELSQKIVSFLAIPKPFINIKKCHCKHGPLTVTLFTVPALSLKCLQKMDDINRHWRRNLGREALHGRWF